MHEELIQRVEAATGPDRELDLALATALVPDVLVMWQRDHDSAVEPYTHWCYTEKIDDALALVERLIPGAEYDISTIYSQAYVHLPLNGGDVEPSAEATRKDGNVPLAIIEAMLRALSARALDHRGDDRGEA